jgi:hypothetical protein
VDTDSGASCITLVYHCGRREPMWCDVVLDVGRGQGCTDASVTARVLRVERWDATCLSIG